MTELEAVNQQIELRDAIIRLCNEADDIGIVLASIIMAYCKYAQAMGMKPNEAKEVFNKAISIMTDY